MQNDGHPWNTVELARFPNGRKQIFVNGVQINNAKVSLHFESDGTQSATLTFNVALIKGFDNGTDVATSSEPGSSGTLRKDAATGLP